jgi:hypothetical protein
VADLPVGLNLHDHLNMPLYVSFTRPNLSLTLNKLRSIRQLSRYLFYREGKKLMWLFNLTEEIFLIMCLLSLKMVAMNFYKV